MLHIYGDKGVGHMTVTLGSASPRPVDGDPSMDRHLLTTKEVGRVALHFPAPVAQPVEPHAPEAWISVAKSFLSGKSTAVQAISKMMDTARGEFETRAENIADPCSVLSAFLYNLTAEQWSGKVPVDPEYAAAMADRIEGAFRQVASFYPIGPKTEVKT